MNFAAQPQTADPAYANLWTGCTNIDSCCSVYIMVSYDSYIISMFMLSIWCCQTAVDILMIVWIMCEFKLLGQLKSYWITPRQM